jgi:macrolide transport system ATP-binding/permease protein
MELCRDMRRVTLVQHGVQDLRFAARQLWKQPTFGLTAILVLALALAVNVAMFCFVDALLLKPLPYADPARLVTAFAIRPDQVQGSQRGNVSYLNFQDWRARSRALTSLGAYDVRPGSTLTTPEGPRLVSGLKVTSGFFRTLGVSLVVGRDFRPDEEGPSASPTTILAYRTWQTRFNGRADVLGQTAVLGGLPHVVIGVLPRDFHFAMAEDAEFWTPIRGRQPCWELRGCRSLEVVARLADGLSIVSATTELDAIVQQLRREFPDPNPMTAKLVPLREVMLGDIRPVMLALLAGATLLLLMACINVVSLLLARSDGRVREMAVRDALGASSRRLTLQFATEAMVLVTVATVVGLLLADGGIRMLVSLLTPEMTRRMPFLAEVGFTARVAGLVAAACTIAIAVFTMAPFLRLRASVRSVALKHGGRGALGTSWRFGRYLMVAQLAIAVILLVSAGLLSKSLYRLLNVDTGFTVGRLATVAVMPISPPVAVAGERTPPALNPQVPGALAREVADRVASIPGVVAVGYADLLPLGPSLAPTSRFVPPGSDTTVAAEDHPVREVSAGYFTALEASLLSGRFLSEDDVASSRRVVIINDTAARQYFPAESAIGRTIVIGAPPAREVIGVVADISDGPLETPAHPAAYIPFNQVGFALVVRTSQPDRSLLPSLVAAIREGRPNLLVRETTMTERMNQQPSASLNRASAWLVGVFAAMALVLSLVGLYGVVAYAVSQRTREIGVRIALGALRRSVYRLVMGDAASLIFVGTALGLLCSVGAAQFIGRLLFDVRPWDVATLAEAAAVLIGSALLATYIPARRAVRIAPIEALRTD